MDAKKSFCGVRRAAVAAGFAAGAVIFLVITGVNIDAGSTPAVPDTRPAPVVNSIGMKLALISAGEFTMGSPADEAGHQPDETQHKVRITKPFLLGVYDVTQKQYADVMGSSPSNFRGDDLPVDGVSRDDAVAFCKKLSEKEGKTYRLPTKAEWEYACRAGSTGPYAGDGKLDDMAWFGGNSVGKTHPVGTKQPNAWGLYDMQGNVWEWCADWYGDYPAGDATDPNGPANGTTRVLRGGTWYIVPECCRAAYRSYDSPDGRLIGYGFRVALDSR